MNGTIVLKGLEWFVRDAPPRTNVLWYFIKPAELRQMFRENGLAMVVYLGLAPRVRNRAFLKLLATRRVEDRFSFVFTRHTLMGYWGLARRK